MAETTRRQFLCAGATGAIATLAGCGSGSETTPGGSEDGGLEGTPTGTGAADGGDGGDAPTLGDASTFADSFAMEATLSTGDQTVEMSGRSHSGDLYWELTQQGQTMQWYLVDDTSYVVTGGQCIKGSMQGSLNRGDVDPGVYEDGISAHPDLKPAGTDTIDGEKVLVYELSSDATAGLDETVTYYVLADTGHLRRIESPSMQFDFHSWGAVDPVEKPDMNCQELPDDGAGDGSS
ncbi:hypothetical protein ACKVMT_11400 [Halobacteriales archaeon Cl-PHB]